MENLTKRVPMINQLILKNIDEKSRDNFKLASRGINRVIEKEKIYWILKMSKYHENFNHGKWSIRWPKISNMRNSYGTWQIHIL